MARATLDESTATGRLALSLYYDPRSGEATGALMDDAFAGEVMLLQADALQDFVDLVTALYVSTLRRLQAEWEALQRATGRPQ